ncbi:MAG: DUF4307 domain-containing protein [Nocardioides sp.]|nr:DUF4307 domain-containing protein [Nocardioides sp.]
MSVDLADRYGTHHPGRRVVLIITIVVAVVVAALWVVWAGWFHSTPRVASEMNTFSVVDTHTAKAVVRVKLDGAVDPNCQIRALSTDHVVVGELNFEPSEGSNEVSIKTVRKASSVDLVGCTAKDQPRPQ